MRKIVPVILSLLLAGCSGKPSDSEIESAIVGKFLADGGDQILQVENYQKINGFEKDSKTYIADVRYDLIFKKSIKELAQQLKQETNGSPREALEAGLTIKLFQMQYGDFEAGHRLTQERKVTLIKTENGWRINGEQ